MKIHNIYPSYQKNNYSHSSFKSIILNEHENTISRSLLTNLQECAESESKKIKNGLFELYLGHLEKEIETKAKCYHHKDDFAQKMFLFFFEALEKIRQKDLSISDFDKTISSIKPGKDELAEGIEECSIDKKYRVKNYSVTLDNILTEENLPIYLSQRSEEEAAVFKQELAKTLGKVKLKDFQQDILESLLDGKTFAEIATQHNVTATCIRNNYAAAIAKIQEANDCLPEEFEFWAHDLCSQTLPANKNILKSKLIEYPQIVWADRNKTKNNIATIANLLDIEESTVIEIGYKYPSIFVRKPETIKNNITQTAKYLGITEKEYIDIVLKHPILLSTKTTKIAENNRSLAKKIKIKEEQLIKISIKNPELLVQNADTILEKTDEGAQILGIEQAQFIKICLKQPTLFVLSPSRLKSNIETNAKLLKISKQEFIKAALKQPQILYQSPNTIHNNMIKSAKAFNLDVSDFVKASLKQPSLFFQKTETLKKHIQETAKELKIDETTLIKMAKRQPALFFQKTETIKNNVENSAKALGVSKECFVKMALQQPQLLSAKAETLKSNIEKIACSLNTSFEKMVALVTQKPQILTVKSETASTKIKLLKYFSQIKNIETEKLAFSTKTLDLMLDDIIGYCIKKQVGDTHITPANYKEYLKNNPNRHYKLALPQNDVREIVANYAKTVFEKYTNGNFELCLEQQNN